MHRTFMYKLLAATTLLLIVAITVSCGGGGGLSGGNGIGVRPADGGSAADDVGIVITAPTAYTSMAIRSSRVTLSGVTTASATSVRVEGTNGFGAIMGSLPRWTCADIPLAPGDNELVATATSATAQTATASIFVVSNPAIGMGDLVVMPDAVIVGQQTPVDFRIVIENVAGLDRADVHLLQVSSRGATLRDLGVMADGGTVAGGRAFTLQIPVNASTPGELTYRVSVKVSGAPYLSAWQAVTAVYDLTAAQAAAVLATNRQAQATLDQAVAAGDGLRTAVEKTAAWLLGQAGVERVTPFIDEDDGVASISIFYTDGIRGVAEITPAGSRGRAGSASRSPSKMAAARLDDGRPAPDSLRALIWAPMAHDFGRDGEDESGLLVELLRGSRAMASCATQDLQADVASCRDLHAYGLIHLETHGLVFHDNSGKAIVTLATDELTTQDGLLAHKTDVRRGLLIIGEQFFITPRFIENYNARQRLPGTLVTGSYCYSAYNESMWLAFAHVGATAYTGWTKAVRSKLAYEHVIGMYQNLCKGQSLQSAFTPYVGEADYNPLRRPQIPPLRSVMFGDGTVCIDAGKVSVSPVSSEVDPSASPTPVPLEAKIEGLDLISAPPSNLTYRWRTSGTYGTLRDLNGKTGNDLVTADPSVAYVPNESAEVPENAKEQVRLTGVVTDCNEDEREIGDAITEIAIKSGSPRIRLAPTTVTLKPEDSTSFTATVLGLAPTTRVTYHWKSTATAGTLTDGTGTNDFDSDRATVTYTARTPGNTDTITVELYALEPNRRLLSSTTARVDVGTVSVQITPAQSTLKALEQEALAASISGLSAGTPVSWRFTCTATVGHLSDGTGSDTFNNSSGNATYTALATAGSDTVTVEAWTTGATARRLGTASANLDVTAATVTLSPATASLTASAQQAFTASVTGIANGATLSYHWTNTAAAGHLSDGTGTDDFNSTQATATYTAGSGTGGSDTLTLVAYATVGASRIQLGTDTSSVTVEGQLIVNGDFSQGYTGWTWVKVAGNRWPSVATTGYRCWKPNDPCASMDVPAGCTQYFEQAVTLPASGTFTLKYSLGGHLNPNVALTVFVVENGTPTQVDSKTTPQMEQYIGPDLVCTGAPPAAGSVNLSAWAGKTVTLRFQATSTGWSGCFALLDDISIEVTP